MILPLRRAIIPGATARPTRKDAFRLCAMNSSQTSCRKFDERQPPLDAGIVDEDIDRADFRLDRRHACLDLAARTVTSKRRACTSRPAPRNSSSVTPRRSALRPLRTTRAPASARPRDRLSQTGSRTGDEGGPAAQIEQRDADAPFTQFSMLVAGLAARCKQPRSRAPRLCRARFGARRSGCVTSAPAYALRKRRLYGARSHR